jgi:hypothetical protein
MGRNLQLAIQTILAGSAITLVSSGAMAGTISPKAATAWVNSSETLGANSSIQTTAAALSSKNSWTDNSALANSSWGHTGTWLVFDVTAANQNVDINAQVLTGNYNVAFTVWASGSSAFNGGSPSNGSIAGLYEPSLVTSGNNPAHDFNQVSQVGSYGTLWATDPSVATNGGGNLLDTLAYANSGIAHTDGSLNDYGQVINSGVNQVATDNTYFSGSVGGSTSASNADLQFQNLAPGWYTLFVGGANSAATTASTYQVTITSSATSAVPLPGAVYLFGSALAGLLTVGRRKLSAA